jgi:hypothetical protein
MACVANAVAAALPEIADQLGSLPLSPDVIWRALHAGWVARVASSRTFTSPPAPR